MDSMVSLAPQLTLDQARELAQSLYGLGVSSCQALPSERDQNFRIEDSAGKRSVLKIANAAEDAEILDFQNAAMTHLHDCGCGVATPHVVSATDGRLIAETTGESGESHFVRLVSWVDGRPMESIKPHSTALLRDIGARLAKMDLALSTFEHPAMRRELLWDLRQAAMARQHLDAVGDAEQRELLARAFDRIETMVLQRVSTLRSQVIHNDWNDHNILVDCESGWPERVAGVIDFGDMVHSHLVCDLAIACTYAMLGKPDPITAAASIVHGFHEQLPLEEAEADLLHELIMARLSISVAMSSRQSALNPENEYLLVSEAPAWSLLDDLMSTAPSWATAKYRAACGFEPVPGSTSIVAWIDTTAGGIAPVIEPGPATQRSVILDLSARSAEHGAGLDPGDVDAGCRFVDDHIARAGATIAIGRYNEPRLVYAGSQFASQGNEGPTPRTIHIGIDLFAPAGTTVHAPLPAVVYSVRDNALPYDYGPTVILEHRAGETNERFWTLYGHLASEVIDRLEPGTTLEAGQAFASFGDPSVNGGWPPHLHFQLITDLFGKSGDYPGVARADERDVWMSACPSPNVLLRLPGDVECATPDAAAIEARRVAHVGPSLSISYRRHLHIVRGQGQYLYDADGRAYLDAVNNVPHVGHCHPRVVEAVQKQAATLNTNTRYLHEMLTEYAERLSSLMPDPLSVIYLTCSGSEANDLALRLARAHTGATGTVVLDGAYHGNLGSLVEMSPYKCEGPGGRGLAPHVRKALMPDPYRGPYKVDQPDAGDRYADDVRRAIDELRSTEHGFAAFFAEPLLGCGGQIVPPAGYLRRAFEIVRASGGVCVADEVQIGFGRVGPTFWGFALQDAVPDIVTLGKPIGNGFPLAAVVTTRQIAASFDNGMEYFNTFGGNPVACAAGLAVLDVIEEEGLAEHAKAIGDHLMNSLRELQARHKIIGDVRGEGLYIGVELVNDRATLDPAARQADYIINRMKDRGVLISTDGPLHNVLKIKPPLVVTRDDADRLVSTVDDVLSETAAQVP